MTVDIQSIANTIYRVVGATAAAKARVDAKLLELAWRMAEGEDSMTLDAFTINGQSFSGKSVPLQTQVAILEAVKKNQTDGVAYRSGHRLVDFS